MVFDQQEGSAGAMEPEGSVPNRRNEEAWLEATEPIRGARPRTMEFDRPVDGGLGAALGGVEDGDKLRDGVLTGFDRWHLRQQRYPGFVVPPVGNSINKYLMR